MLLAVFLRKVFQDTEFRLFAADPYYAFSSKETTQSTRPDSW